MNPIKVKLIQQSLSNNRKKLIQQKDLRQRELLKLHIKIDELKLKMERLK